MVVVVKKDSSKKTIQRLIKKLHKKKPIDLKKHFGVIKLTESPVAIQRKMRDEWQ